MKTYYTQQNIGKAKYVVNFYDGQSTHDDGSPFFRMRTFSNKKELKKFEQKLTSEGYMYA